MTLPRHPLLRALLALWGLLFMIGLLLVGLVAAGVLLLWSWLLGRSQGRRPSPLSAFGRPGNLFTVFRSAAAPGRASPRPGASADVIEGEARDVTTRPTS